MMKNALLVIAIVVFLLLITRKMKLSILANQIIRSDSEGDGNFGASRGNRTHQGVDLVVKEGDQVKAPENGTIRRKAYPYANDLRWKGLILDSDSGIEYRIYYLTPDDRLIGKKVSKGDVIGIAQDISKKYTNKMTPHIHVETRLSGQLFNPAEILAL